jgi:hypothetical protein
MVEDSVSRSRIVELREASMHCASAIADFERHLVSFQVAEGSRIRARLFVERLARVKKDQ